MLIENKSIFFIILIFATNAVSAISATKPDSSLVEEVGHTNVTNDEVNKANLSELPSSIDLKEPITKEIKVTATSERIGSSATETASKTSKPTTTTTTKPTTTTTTTTTTKPTTPTTTTTTTTTTTKPTTTTTKPTPTTTTTPKPDPKPTVAKWNSSCVMIQMAAQFNLTYITKDSKNATAVVNLPSTAIVYDSSCEAVMQTISLQWGSNADVNTFHLAFGASNTSYSLQSVYLDIIADEFPDAKENQTVRLYHQRNEFETPLQMSYHCTKEQDLNLTHTLQEKSSDSFLMLSDLQLEAFRTTNSSQFSNAKDCAARDTPDIVPIAVGIALVLLILIVLISYLFARRRSTARGYMSF